MPTILSDMMSVVNRRNFLIAGGPRLAFRQWRKTRDIRKAITYATIQMDITIMAKFKAVQEAGFAGLEPMSHMPQREVFDAFAATV
jgi:hypothetical protein